MRDQITFLRSVNLVFFCFQYFVLLSCSFMMNGNWIKIMWGSFNNKDAYSRKGASVLNWIPGGVFRF